MATLALQDVGTGGIANITFTAAAAGGDSVPAGEQGAGWGLHQVVLLVKNGDTTAATVTVAGLAGVVVPATTGQAAIPVNVGVAPGRLIGVTYSKVTSLTVAAINV